MIIREAKENELQEIMLFYSMMCEELGKKEFLPNGNKVGFPSQEMGTRLTGYRNTPRRNGMRIKMLQNFQKSLTFRN